MQPEARRRAADQVDFTQHHYMHSWAEQRFNWTTFLSQYTCKVSELSCSAKKRPTSMPWTVGGENEDILLLLKFLCSSLYV